MKLGRMKSTFITSEIKIVCKVGSLIQAHASLRMLNFLAGVMREFYKEIGRKNRIFGRKTDILRNFVAGCPILLNIYGKKD